MPSVGLAPHDPQPRLPSPVCRVVQLEIRVACARARHNLCRHGGRERQDAGLAWESLVRGGLACEERDRIRKALLKYCGQDTLALVKVLEKPKLEARAVSKSRRSRLATTYGE